MKQRERLGSRLGFILLSAGCAIGLGNVWRFPYVVAKNGGAVFLLIYLLFLFALGVPIMVMEFSVGRASRKSIAKSFRELEPEGTHWHIFGYIGIAGNYVLMMFYTTVSGWMLAYLIKMAKGDFSGLNLQGVEQEFDSVLSNPIMMTVFMVVVVVVGFGVCSLGLQNGVEKITKIMMGFLIVTMIILAIRSVTLPGAGEGLKYYLLPDFSRVQEQGIRNVLMAALGQAFFTLSIGMGSMAIFGSYLGNKRRLLGETLNVTLLDTSVAIVAGLIIIPACFAYKVDLNAGPSLIFITLPNLFNAMPFGRVWGTLFFIFMVFAASSTIIAVFENIVSSTMDIWNFARTKACFVNVFAILILSMPCILGFNLWSTFQPLGAGTNVLDLEDFIVSNNILPIGSLIYLMFCCTKHGWGWKNFIEEANQGEAGFKFPKGCYLYVKYVIPIIVIFILLQGYLDMLFK